VDVGAREEISRIISTLVEQGLAVLLISSDLIEVMSMSHRIGLYARGRLLRVAAAETLTAVDIMAELTSSLAA
jgi:ABC-type sugar transport system ATPase subunit